MPRRDPAAAARAAMPERYGPPRRFPRSVLVAVVAVVATAGLGWLLWAATVNATPDVAGGVADYRVVSEARTDVTIEVRRRVSDPVSCEVYAQAADTSVVGERSVALAAGAPGTTTTTVSIATIRRAVTARLRSCTVE